jgi:hypothetical protein
MMFPEEAKKLSTGEKNQQDNGSGGKMRKTNESLNKVLGDSREYRL